MSRAFVKETDGDPALEDLPDLPVSPHPNFVTPTGLKQLRDRLDLLTAQLSVAQKSASLEDRQSIPRLRRDIRYLKSRIERAILVGTRLSPPDEVCFGVSVEVEDPAGHRSIFALVGEDEADAASGKVSWISPLARALIGKSPGAQVVWHRPSGNLELTLLAIYVDTDLPAIKDSDLPPIT